MEVLYKYFIFIFYLHTTLYKSAQVTVLVMQYDIALNTFDRNFQSNLCHHLVTLKIKLLYFQ